MLKDLKNISLNRNSEHEIQNKWNFQEIYKNEI